MENPFEIILERLEEIKKAFENHNQEKMVNQFNTLMKTSFLAIENMEKNINVLNPINVLKRGFSITYSNGKSIKAASQLSEREKINTVLYHGTIESTITKIKE